MRATSKPPSDEEVRAIRARWRMRGEFPTTLFELGREFRRCDRTIKRIILAGGQDVPKRGFQNIVRSKSRSRRQETASAARTFRPDELIAYARQHSTINRALARIMEVPR